MGGHGSDASAVLADGGVVDDGDGGGGVAAVDYDELGGIGAFDLALAY